MRPMLHGILAVYVHVEMSFNAFATLDSSILTHLAVALWPWSGSKYPLVVHVVRYGPSSLPQPPTLLS